MSPQPKFKMRGISYLVLFGTLASVSSLIDGAQPFHPSVDDNQLQFSFLENLVGSMVDSRFKLLAVGFQDQIDELKTTVGMDVRKNESSTLNSKTNNHVIQKRENQGTKASTKSTPSVCSSSSSFCTYFYPDHPDARRKKSNYTAKVINTMLADPSNTKGMPTSCKDLQLLGHELSGFYSVRTSQQDQGTRIETVFCNFQSPTDSNGGLEARIGIVNIKSSLVHFYVHRTGHFGDHGQKITFEQQHLNVGNGFDWENQWFLAPHPGTYFFSISGSRIWSPNADPASVIAKLNGENVGEALSSQNTEYGALSYQFSLKLKSGDKIELFAQHGKMYFLYFTGWMVDENLVLI